jgi:hypothetical protein
VSGTSAEFGGSLYKLLPIIYSIFYAFYVKKTKPLLNNSTAATGCPDREAEGPDSFASQTFACFAFLQLKDNTKPWLMQ